MNRPRTWIPLLMCLLLLAWGQSVISYSDGPPEARTGAPGELSCYNGYCHNSFPLNAGNARIELQADLPEGGYVPGQVYEFEARVADPGMRRFGLQLQTTDQGATRGAGTFVEFNEEELQLLDAAERTYLTHSLAQAVNDSASWHFSWQAPTAGTGPVQVYAAFVTADANGNRSGDYVYTRQMTLEEQRSTRRLQEAISQQLDVFPTQAIDAVQLDWRGNAPLRAAVYSLEGTLIQRLPVLHKGRHQLETSHWAAGLYLLRFQAERVEWSQKLLKISQP